MDFKTWLEYEEKDLGFYRNLVLGKLDLESPEGMSVTLDSFNSENLIEQLRSLGEFKELSQELQQRIVDKVKTGDGTVGDIVGMMAGERA